MLFNLPIKVSAFIWTRRTTEEKPFLMLDNTKVAGSQWSKTLKEHLPTEAMLLRLMETTKHLILMEVALIMETTLFNGKLILEEIKLGSSFPPLSLFLSNNPNNRKFHRFPLFPPFPLFPQISLLSLNSLKSKDSFPTGTHQVLAMLSKLGDNRDSKASRDKDGDSRANKDKEDGDSRVSKASRDKDGDNKASRDKDGDNKASRVKDGDSRANKDKEDGEATAKKDGAMVVIRVIMEAMEAMEVKVVIKRKATLWATLTTLS